MKRFLVLLAAFFATIATNALASDYFDASGIPVQRSTISSAEFRSEFSAIETGISDKLPPLTGNGDKWVRVNAGGTALTSASTSVLTAALGLNIGTDVQAWDTQLDDIAALAVTNGNFIVGDGANWVVENGATARTSLGLGSLATLSLIDNDNWDNTDLSIANGGTGASTAGAALAALGGNDAANLSTGELADARLSSNVPLLDADNTFTGIFLVSSNAPSWALTETDAPADEQDWTARSVSGDFRLTAWDAGFSVGTDFLTVAKTGTTVDSIAWASTALTWGGNTLFTTANDGAGSGLDADLLDGNSSAYFSNAANLGTGELADARLSSNVPLLDGAGTVWTGGNQRIDTNDPQWRLNELDAAADEGDWSINSSGGNFNLTSFSDGFLSANNFFTATSTGATISAINLASTALTWNSNALFTTANDGAGSGLDADLLDGNSSAYFQVQSAVLDATTASYTVALNTKLGNIETAADVTDATNVAAAGAPIISSGAGAPGSTPAAVGDIYIDTTNDYSYLATGTASSADWKQASGLGGGDLLAANNLSDVTVAATARTNLGLAIGSDVQAYDADLGTIAGLAKTDSNFIVGNGSAWVLEPAATARTSLGLGALATLATVNNGEWSGTDLSVANGGTGASTLTGLLSGNGTGAITGSTTINNGDWSGTDLAVANGGTGSSTASGARTALGLAIGTDVQAYDAGLLAIAGLSSADSNIIVGSAGGWVAETGATARNSLGLGSLATLSAIDNDNWDTTDLAVANGGTGSSTASSARTALGLALGSDVQAWSAVLDATTASYTSALNTKLGNIETAADVTDATNVAAAGAPIITSGAGSPSSTPAAVGDIYVDTTGDVAWTAAGTASSADWKQSTGTGGGDLLAANNLSDVAVAATARTNLGLAIGSNVQAHDGDLDTIAGLAKTANNIMVGTGSAWALETPAQVRASIDLEPGTDVQAYDAELAEIAALLDTNNNFIVGNGTAWVAESGATARASLGVSIGSQVQAYDGDLAAIAGFAKTNNNFMVANGSAWALETPAQVRASLDLEAGTDLHAYDSDLAAIAVLDNSDSNIIVGSAGGWVAESGATARTSLGLGTGDSPQLTAVNIGAATDTTLSRDSAGKLAVEGRPMLTHDDATYASARIIVTDTAPTDTTGMATGDIKLVY